MNLQPFAAPEPLKTVFNFYHVCFLALSVLLLFFPCLSLVPSFILFFLLGYSCSTCFFPLQRFKIFFRKQCREKTHTPTVTFGVSEMLFKYPLGCTQCRFLLKINYSIREQQLCFPIDILQYFINFNVNNCLHNLYSATCVITYY